MLLLIKHEGFVLPVCHLQHSQECNCWSFAVRLTKCLIWLLVIVDLRETLGCYSPKWMEQKQADRHWAQMNNCRAWKHFWVCRGRGMGEKGNAGFWEVELCAAFNILLLSINNWNLYIRSMQVKLTKKGPVGGCSVLSMSRSQTQSWELVLLHPLAMCNKLKSLTPLTFFFHCEYEGDHILSKIYLQ